MNTKIALAAFAAASLSVAPAFAEDAAATTTTTTTEATPATTATAATTTTTTETSEGKEFGNPGVINFAAETGLDFHTTSNKFNGNDAGSSSHFGIKPSIDYFLAEGISIGGVLGYEMDSVKAAGASDSDSSSTFRIGPRVGYNLWLSPPKLSLWPKIGIDYHSTSTKSKGADGPSFSGVGLNVSVPLIIHPVKHFHVGIGPYLNLDLTSKASQGGVSADGPKGTTFGIAAEIAGWL